MLVTLNEMRPLGPNFAPFHVFWWGSTMVTSLVSWLYSMRLPRHVPGLQSLVQLRRTGRQAGGSHECVAQMRGPVLTEKNSAEGRQAGRQQARQGLAHMCIGTLFDLRGQSQVHGQGLQTHLGACTPVVGKVRRLEADDSRGAQGRTVPGGMASSAQARVDGGVGGGGSVTMCVYVCDCVCVPGESVCLDEWRRPPCCGCLHLSHPHTRCHTPCTLGPYDSPAPLTPPYTPD